MSFIKNIFVMVYYGKMVNGLYLYRALWCPGDPKPLYTIFSYSHYWMVVTAGLGNLSEARLPRTSTTRPKDTITDGGSGNQGTMVYVLYFLKDAPLNNNLCSEGLQLQFLCAIQVCGSRTVGSEWSLRIQPTFITSLFTSLVNGSATVQHKAALQSFLFKMFSLSISNGNIAVRKRVFFYYLKLPGILDQHLMSSDKMNSN